MCRTATKTVMVSHLQAHTQPVMEMIGFCNRMLQFILTCVIISQAMCCNGQSSLLKTTVQFIGMSVQLHFFRKT